MERAIKAQHEHLGTGRRRKEDLRHLVVQALLGAVIAIASVLVPRSTAHALNSPQVLSIFTLGGAILGGLLIGNLLARVPNPRDAARVQRLLLALQRWLFLLLVLFAIILDVVAAVVLTWMFSRDSSGPADSWTLIVGLVALTAVGVMMVAAATEPVPFSVRHRPWLAKVGSAGALASAAAVLMVVTTAAWSVAGGPSALAVAIAVALAQVGWGITAELQRSRTIRDLTAVTRELATIAVTATPPANVHGSSADTLARLLDLEALVLRPGWRLPFSIRSRQLFDREVVAMIHALVAAALPVGYTVHLTPLSRRVYWEILSMPGDGLRVAVGEFATDLRHLCVGAPRWMWGRTD